jgi:hypothetical protein
LPGGPRPEWANRSAATGRSSEMIVHLRRGDSVVFLGRQI